MTLIIFLASTKLDHVLFSLKINWIKPAQQALSRIKFSFIYKVNPYWTFTKKLIQFRIHIQYNFYFIKKFKYEL